MENREIEKIEINTKEDAMKELSVLKQKVENGINPTLKDKYEFTLIKRYIEAERLNFNDGEFDILDNSLSKIQEWCDKIINPVDTVYNEQTGSIHRGEKMNKEEVFVALLDENELARDGLFVTEREGLYVLRDYILCGNQYFLNDNERTYESNRSEEIVEKIRNISRNVKKSPVKNYVYVLNKGVFDKFKEMHKMDEYATIQTLITIDQMKKELAKYQSVEETKKI